MWDILYRKRIDSLSLSLSLSLTIDRRSPSPFFLRRFAHLVRSDVKGEDPRRAKSHPTSDRRERRDGERDTNNSSKSGGDLERKVANAEHEYRRVVILDGAFRSRSRVPLVDTLADVSDRWFATQGKKKPERERERS